MFSAGLIGLVAVTLWLAVLLLNVGWLETGYPYEGQEGASAALFAPGQARENILIVGLFDGTIDQVMDFAASGRIEGVTADTRTWRGIHGHLMRRLAAARPKAVVWDYFFRRPTKQDADFVAGVKELEESGVPVILASQAYHDDGTPDLSPDILAPLAGRVRHGAISARDMVERPGEFVLANKRKPQTVVPSLALATLAAMLHPQAFLELEWDEQDRWIDLHYRIHPGAYLRGRDRIELDRVFHAQHSQHGIRVGDLLACRKFELATLESWQRQTTRYERLLSCSDDQLRALVRDRLLIIGDLRTARFGFSADRHRVKYDSLIINDVPGCYLLADAIAGLLTRRYVRLVVLLPTTALLFALVLATVGCLLPIRLAAYPIFEQARCRRVLWFVLLGLSASSFLVMVATTNYAAVCLGFVGLSLLPPMAGAFGIEFARNRHRLLERNRRAIDRCAVASVETATLRR
jgi:CHASE2 domain-containing sensor protein